MFGRTHLWNCLVLDFCYLGTFLITVLISVIVIGLFKFLFPHDLVLEGYIILRICPFLLGCQICWCMAIYNILLQFFVLLWHPLLFILFHFWFVYEGLLSSLFSYNSLYFCGIHSYLSSFTSGGSLFFLVSLANGLLILFIFLKIQLLVSLIFFIVFLYFIYFNSNLYYFLPSINWSFACSSFSSPFRCKVR